MPFPLPDTSAAPSLCDRAAADEDLVVGHPFILQMLAPSSVCDQATADEDHIVGNPSWRRTPVPLLLRATKRNCVMLSLMRTGWARDEGRSGSPSKAAQRFAQSSALLSSLGGFVVKRTIWARSPAHVPPLRLPTPPAVRTAGSLGQVAAARHSSAALITSEPTLLPLSGATNSSQIGILLSQSGVLLNKISKDMVNVSFYLPYTYWGSTETGIQTRLQVEGRHEPDWKLGIWSSVRQIESFMFFLAGPSL